MEGKIDNILTAVKNLTDTNVNLVRRIASLEEKLDKYDDNIAEFNEKLAKQEHKIKHISNDLEEKVSLADYHELCDRIARLELEKKEAKKLELQRESYSKRLNLLIHGLDEVGSTVWETKTQTLDIFNKFVTDGLGLDPKSISLVDIHRLPQRPVVKQGRNITRPIIIKLATAMDKHIVMSNLKNLKAYNLKKQNFNNDHFHAGSSHRKSSVFITDHLPKEYYERKKKLMPAFKSACKFHKKTRWAIHNGDYCLFVDDELVTMY